MKYLFILLSLLLASCSTYHPEEIVKNNTVYQKESLIVVDSKLLDKCPDLPKLERKNYSQKQALSILKNWIYYYHACQKRHELLSNWVHEVSGMKNVNK